MSIILERVKLRGYRSFMLCIGLLLTTTQAISEWYSSDESDAASDLIFHNVTSSIHYDQNNQEFGVGMYCYSHGEKREPLSLYIATLPGGFSTPRAVVFHPMGVGNFGFKHLSVDKDGAKVFVNLQNEEESLMLMSLIAIMQGAKSMVVSLVHTQGLSIVDIPLDGFDTASDSMLNNCTMPLLSVNEGL